MPVGSGRTSPRASAGPRAPAGRRRDARSAPAPIANPHQIGAAGRSPPARAAAGGQHAAIAEARAGIDHHQRQYPGAGAGILEPVIHRQRLRPGGDRPFAGVRGSVAPPPDRREGGKQQRLVADLGRAMAPLLDTDRAPQAAAMAARQDMNRDAAPAAAGPARSRWASCRCRQRWVADADHRDARAGRAGCLSRRAVAR